MSSKFVRLSDRVVINTDHIVWYALYEVDGYAAQLHFAGEREPMTLNASERAALEKHLFGGKEDGEDDPDALNAEFREWATSAGLTVPPHLHATAYCTVGNWKLKIVRGMEDGTVDILKDDDSVGDVMLDRGIPRGDALDRIKAVKGQLKNATDRPEPKEQPFDEWARSLGMFVSEKNKFTAVGIVSNLLVTFYSLNSGGVNVTQQERSGKATTIGLNVSRESARKFLFGLASIKES